MGIHGYITKFSEVEDFERAIYDVIDKGYYYSGEVAMLLVNKFRAESRPAEVQTRSGRLTFREREIIGLICKDLNSETIAGQLNISLKTLQNHKQNIFNKTGTKGILSLFQYAQRNGLG